jgi:ATP-dependent Clp protease ATP-binding subunit ClpC
VGRRGAEPEQADQELARLVLAVYAHHDHGRGDEFSMIASSDTADSLLGLAILVGVFVAAFWIGRARSPSGDRPAVHVTPDAPSPADVVAHMDARAVREQVDDVSIWSLEDCASFHEGVERLRAAGLPTEELLTLSAAGDEVVRCMALRVLRERDDLPADWVQTVLDRLSRSGLADEHELLATIVHAPGRLIGPVITRMDRLTSEALATFLRQRVEGGEPVDDDTFARLPLDFATAHAEILSDELYVPPVVAAAFRSWWDPQETRGHLQTVGRVWTAPFDVPSAIEVADRPAIIGRASELLGAAPRRSVVLIGEQGCGKSVLLRAALARGAGDAIVFETTAAQLNAGASFVGQLEGRVAELIRHIEGRDVICVLPNLEHALSAGRSSVSPLGLLDALLPHIASGTLVIAGETTPQGWQTLVKARPVVNSVFTAIRVRPLDEAASVVVARGAVVDRYATEVPDATLAAGYELTQQFLPGTAQPGALLRIVSAAAERAEERDEGELSEGDLLAVLAERSGLPLALLDATAPLDLASVRRLFEERVIGQPEAIECLVDRIAMIKAGLTDPTRPLGVFLFVGPTGTGKTEIAKVLAEQLFGSSARLVRLDMSEFQTPASLERLLADASTDTYASPLLEAVRNDPFSVILLDEFEKAAQPVWDLFLQVFDDGRLTDVQGNLVDFRRTVVILTSNLGASIAGGASVGFHRSAQPFRREAVAREIKSAFRPEFLNRIDRVVVFRPFEQEQMRALLDKELRDVVQRRGLRERPWAVEYDEAALRFLIDEGFSPELGARPLKRAVEEHLLAPLAKAIVQHTVPSGDQFLFVTARRDGLEVSFVDPDAPDAGAHDDGLAEASRQELTLAHLALSPRADAGALAYLKDQADRLNEVVHGPDIQGRKAAALARLGRDGFWDDPDRFTVLAEANYLDRLDEAMRTAMRLARRLGRGGDANGGGARLVELLALRLHVIENAVTAVRTASGEEVFLRVRVAGRTSPVAEVFVERLVSMYLGWGERRGMHVELLGPPADGEQLLLIGGLGAIPLLEAEEGLHVLDAHEDTARVTAMVELAPRPLETADERDLAELARRVLADTPRDNRVVRRYRQLPSPLVRDSVRGFRTGRLDRVLAGDFDLL